MHRSAKLLSIVLTALFWIAQIQGTAHGISHLRLGAGVQDQAPVSLVCADCLAFSQSGAAPVAALQAPPNVRVADARPGLFGIDRLESPRTLGFRSRAPPSISI